MNYTEKWSRLYSLIIANGGGTFDIEGNLKVFKRGYMVSITNNTVADNTTLELLIVGAKLSKGFIGFWVSPKKEIFRDISLHIKSKKQAIMVGKLFNQQSLYDCYNQKVINL